MTHTNRARFVFQAMVYIGSFKRNSRFNKGIMDMHSAPAPEEAAVSTSTSAGTAGLSLTMNMAGISERYPLTILIYQRMVGR